jgi:hypothetical protein
MFIKKKITLDQQIPFSQASIWQWQRDFYAKKGLDAWDSCVPFLITNNVVIAEQYATAIYLLVKGLCEQKQFDLTQPLPIIELGAGHGRFAFLVLKSLMPMLTAYNPKIKLLYILTDYAKRNIEFWQDQPQLSAFVENKTLDFALFDLDHPEKPIVGNISNKTINTSNPLVLFANYIIDTIASDYYSFTQDQMNWATLTTTTDKKNIKQGGPKDFSEINYTIDYTACPRKNDAPNFMQSIWSHYQKLQLKHIPIPEIFLNALNILVDQGHEKLFLIASDHGYTNLDELKIASPPELKRHHSFSIMVNFDAISHYFTYKKGRGYTGQKTDQGLKTCFFSLNMDTDAMTDLTTHMRQVTDRFNAADFLELIKPLKDKSNKNLSSWISLLKLCDWDPIIFQRYKKYIHKLLKEHMNDSEHKNSFWHNSLVASLTAGLERTTYWFYFMPNKNANLYFDIAHTYHIINHWDKAIHYYLESEKYFALDFETAYNLTICYINTEKKTKALDYFDQAQSLKKDCPNQKEILDLITLIKK